MIMILMGHGAWGMAVGMFGLRKLLGSMSMGSSITGLPPLTINPSSAPKITPLSRCSYSYSCSYLFVCRPLG